VEKVSHIPEKDPESWTRESEEKISPDNLTKIEETAQDIQKCFCFFNWSLKCIFKLPLCT